MSMNAVTKAVTIREAATIWQEAGGLVRRSLALLV
jgi:hypothetical protein